MTPVFRNLCPQCGSDVFEEGMLPFRCGKLRTCLNCGKIYRGPMPWDDTILVMVFGSVIIAGSLFIMRHAGLLPVLIVGMATGSALLLFGVLSILCRCRPENGRVPGFSIEPLNPAPTSPPSSKSPPTPPDAPARKTLPQARNGADRPNRC
jgi:hypothetical protein